MTDIPVNPLLSSSTNSPSLIDYSNLGNLWRRKVVTYFTAYLGKKFGYYDPTDENNSGLIEDNIWYAPYFLYPNHWRPGKKIPFEIQHVSWYAIWWRVTYPIFLLLLVIFIFFLFIL